MVDKKILVKEFIQNNPSLNSTDTLKELQLLGLGIRRTIYLGIFREVRKLPEPTKAKREKSIPIKFRPTKPKVKPTPKAKSTFKRGSYGIIEFIDDDTLDSYWIKYKNKKDLDNQIDKLKKHYRIKKFSIINHGINQYVSFIDSQFKEILSSIGVNP